MFTVNPVEAPGALTNPFMGFRPKTDYAKTPYPTVIHQYIPWKTIENLESDSVQKIRDYSNAQWANLPADNVRVIPRVYIDWDSKTGNESWPSDLTPGDWSSPEFKARVVRLVGRLGEVWNNDPRVAWVQTGLIGYWGEQESPVGIDDDGWAQRLGDAFTAAFPNKKFIVRNMGDWPGYNVGVYWDSFGHPGQRNGAWSAIKNFNNQGRYLTDVVEGEVAYDWGVEGEFANLYGSYWDPTANGGLGAWKSSPNTTFSNAQSTDNMIDVIRELHCSALGWISGYDFTNPTIAANAARMQKEFGYRFHITEFTCDARANPGSDLKFQFRVKNKGSAPIYENWPLAVTLIDKVTRQLIWKATIPNVDIRKWHPGHHYSYTTRTYQTPAQEHLVSASIPLPANLPVGEHLIGLTILEPLSRTPGVFFAVPNFFKQSQTQPLAKIGIGMNATGHTLDGIAFDDLVNHDTRSYILTPQGPFYTLVALASGQGTISQQPTNGNYAKDTGVEVWADGGLGYKFSSWGGALAGSTTNPTIVVMDGNKTISANYEPIPTYSLTTSGTNGSIILDPPGGIYNKGAVVKVTALPNNYFGFSNWTGAHSGVDNPMTITMNGNQTVSAHFSRVVTTLTGWVSGTANPKINGVNRLMTVMVMGESSGDFAATSVTYGGQTMTKRTERLFGTGNRTYAALFTLGETGVNTANSGTIAVNWSTTPTSGSAVYSVLLAGVDQLNPVSVVGAHALTGTSISASTALSTGSGDMVVMCGATEANHNIDLYVGFTENFESNTSWGDATGGSKLGVGAAETPGFTQSTSGRMVLCAMVVKKAPDLFSNWSGGAGFDVDTNNDSINNGIAWLLGAASPSDPINSFRPVVIESADNLKMAFKMRPSSERDGAKLIVEYCSDLGVSGPWTAVPVPDTTGGTSPITFRVSGTNPLAVEVDISPTGPNVSQLFTRLRAER